VLSSDRPNLVNQTLRAQFRAVVADAHLLDRWRTLLASFAVIDWRTKSQDGRDALAKSWLSHLRKEPLPRTLEGVRELLDERKDRVAFDALTAEAKADAFVRAVCASIESRLPAYKPYRDRATVSAAMASPSPRNTWNAPLNVRAPAPRFAGAISW